MTMSVDITFDRNLYDESAIMETVEEFRAVARIEISDAGDDIRVTVSAADEDVYGIAGALSNLALARSIEVRS
jgi:precorrin-3B methylase